MNDIALLKGTKKSRKKKSFGEKIFSVKDIALLKVTKKDVGKILSLLAGKLSLEKKVCAFEWSLALSQEYTKSFGRKNLALCNGFDPSKVRVYV